MDIYTFLQWGEPIKKHHRGLFISTSLVVAILAVVALLSGFRAILAQASTVKVGLIVMGNLDDMGFNWLSYQGLLRAETEFGVVGSVYTSTEIITDTRQCALDGNDLCIGVGFLTAEAISTTALVFTDTKFVYIDGSYLTYPPNLRGVIFASEEVGYLAGTLATLMNQTDVIGAVCGMEITPVTAFTYGYSNGAHCANPAVTTIISYTNTFFDPILGAQVAQSQIKQGADVVFGVGGLTGNSAILTATQSSVWGIGVDTDQYLTLYMSGTVPGSDYLLTSAMKRVDNAVFNTISDVVSGTFTSGKVTYDLATDGLGLAPFHETEASIPLSVRTQLDRVKRAIIAGSIDPLDLNGPCLVIQQQFLPLTIH
jgi:basic membrane protein A